MSHDITAIIDNQGITATIDQTAIAVDFGGGVINVSGLDSHYSMDFEFLSEVTVPHNLGKRPSITVLDTAGTQTATFGSTGYVKTATCVITLRQATVASGPIFKVYNGSTWDSSVVKVYNGATWDEATPNVIE